MGRNFRYVGVAISRRLERRKALISEGWPSNVNVAQTNGQQLDSRPRRHRPFEDVALGVVLTHDKPTKFGYAAKEKGFGLSILKEFIRFVA